MHGKSTDKCIFSAFLRSPKNSGLRINQRNGLVVFYKAVPLVGAEGVEPPTLCL